MFFCAALLLLSGVVPVFATETKGECKDKESNIALIGHPCEGVTAGRNTASIVKLFNDLDIYGVDATNAIQMLKDYGLEQCLRGKYVCSKDTEYKVKCRDVFGNKKYLPESYIGISLIDYCCAYKMLFQVSFTSLPKSTIKSVKVLLNMQKNSNKSCNNICNKIGKSCVGFGSYDSMDCSRYSPVPVCCWNPTKECKNFKELDAYTLSSNEDDTKTFGFCYNVPLEEAFISSEDPNPGLTLNQKMCAYKFGSSDDKKTYIFTETTQFGRANRPCIDKAEYEAKGKSCIKSTLIPAGSTYCYCR